MMDGIEGLLNEQDDSDPAPLLRAFCESIPSSCILVDRQLRVRRFNRQASEFGMGLFATPLAHGSYLPALLGPGPAEGQCKHYLQQALAGSPASGELHLPMPAGGGRWLHLSCAPVLGAQQVPIGANCLWHDIGPLKQAELQQSQDLAELSQRFGAIFANAVEACWFLDRGLGLVLFNQRAAERGKALLGIELEMGMDGRTLLGLASAQRGHLAQDLERALGGQATTRELEVWRPDGLSDWIRLGCAPVRDAAGEVVGVHCHVQDINARKRSEQILLKQQQKLRDSESRFRAIYESMANGNIFFSPQGQVLAFNQAAVQLGRFFDANEIKIGQTAAEYFSLGFYPLFQHFFHLALAGQAAVDTRELVHGGHQRTWLELAYAPVHDPQGKVLGVDFNVSNIHERKMREQQLREQNDQLQRFAHLTSHYLRGPVASLLSLTSWSEAGQAGPSPEEAQEILQQFKERALQLDQVIHDMMGLVTDPAYQGGWQGFERDTAQRVVSEAPHIMLVDDDPIINAISQRFISKLRPQAKVAQFLNPEVALDSLLSLAPSHLPDLIMLDLQMPEMSGWDFLEHLAHAKLPVQVYMLTSSKNPLDQERAKRYDMVQGFIAKPLNEEKLKIIFAQCRCPGFWG
jgi:PAS domain S-box-containing protein